MSLAFSLILLGGLWLAMIGLWIVSLWRRDASLIDLFWGAGFAAVALAVWGRLGSGGGLPASLFLGLAVIWGLRLSLYLTWRNWGRGEDPRYQAIRQRYGQRFPLLSLPVVFLFQGTLIWIISWPLQRLGAIPPSSWGIAETIGVLLWSVGFLFEAGGDWQLARFLRQPANRGQVLDRGFWALTRHPNYFGDAMIWWGLSVPVLARGGREVSFLLSPLLMTWLLRRFSGVPLLERSLVERRPAYRDYIERTNAFFPGWPRRSTRISEPPTRVAEMESGPEAAHRTIRLQRVGLWVLLTLILLVLLYRWSRMGGN
jgi:steroid 5-alpha reductase family enzyme